MRRRLLFLFCGIALVLVVGAAARLFLSRSSQSMMVPYFRFVDPTLRSFRNAAAPLRGPIEIGSPQSVSGLPTAEIAADTRYVFSAPQRGVVLSKGGIVVPSDAHLVLTSNLGRGKAFRGTERIALLPSVHYGFNLTELAAKTVSVVGEGAGRRVNIELSLPHKFSGKTVSIYVEGLGVKEKRQFVHRTALVDIPAYAVLEFALGILKPGWSQNPVVFEVKACDRENKCDGIFSETVDPKNTDARNWQNRRISLEGFAGQSRSFVFEARVTGGAGSYSFPKWGNPTIYAPASRGAGDVNIILFSIDTLRADHLPTYGYGKETAPFLDKMFRLGGTVFDDCVAAAASTPQSHMSMFTSLQPSVHGITTGSEVLPSWIQTLPEVLRKHGFETGAVTEDGWLGIGLGFGRGVDTYAENRSSSFVNPKGQVDVTLARARRWLSWNGKKRFFLFLHTYQVHEPYTPPKAYRGLFADKNGVPVTQNSPRADRERVEYDEEIRYTDDQFHAFFKWLVAHGLDRHMIFIVTSDHGEAFFEHGFGRHGTYLYEEVTHVPLMLWGPGHIPAGRRIGVPVGHIDLMPSILELAGVPVPAQATGTSFVPLLNGRTEKVRPLFTEGWQDMALNADYQYVPFLRPAFAVQLGNRKLVRYRTRDGFRYEYYDLQKDPAEKHNLYEQMEGQVADLKELLDTYQVSCKAEAADLARRNRESPSQKPKHVRISPAQAEKMRALGYDVH